MFVYLFMLIIMAEKIFLFSLKTIVHLQLIMKKKKIKYSGIIPLLAFFVLFFLLTISCKQSNYTQESQDSSRIVSDDISNQQITSFAEDALGHMWIGTFRGLNKSVVHEYHQYFSSADSTGLCNNLIRNVFKDSKNRLWIATSDGICLYTDQDGFKEIRNLSLSQNVMNILEDNDGRIFLNMIISLQEYNPQSEQFETVIFFDPEENFTNRCFFDKMNHLWSVTTTSIRCFNTLTYEEIFNLKTDKFYHYVFMHDNGELWLASDNRLSIFDTKSTKFIEIPRIVKNHPVLSQAVITYIYAYSDTSLLLNTTDGMFLYDYVSGMVIHQSENGFPFEVPDFIISTMFIDSQKNLWIGSHDQGYVVRYSYKNLFNNNNFLRIHTDRRSVTSIVKDKEERIWMTTQMHGVSTYNIAEKTFSHIDTEKILPINSYFPNNIVRIFIDNDNAIWLMTDLRKVIKCRYNNKELCEEAVFEIPITSISCMSQDGLGTIYLAGFGENIYTLGKDDKEFKTVPLYPKTFVYTNGLIKLWSGEMLVASFGQNLRLINPENQSISEININKYIHRSVFIPSVLFQDSEGNVWIGTHSNGLFCYRYKTQTIEAVGGVSCDDISDIQEDAQGNLWVSTVYGLSKYDRTANKFTNYDKSDGIGGNQFNERSSCRLTDGTLIFGGTHGLTFFNPIDVIIRKNIPLLFEDLKIYNKLIIPNKSNNINKQMAYNPDIHLRHDENSFSISFVALDYTEYERVRYFYMLENSDKFWINAGSNKSVNYSNLPAGKYKFRVKITNNDHTIDINENSINVFITPAPWLSWWAYCFYCLSVIIMILFIYKIYKRINADKQTTAQARIEKEQEQKINSMNMSFFANISHEFRTPLTMISGPVNQLCDDNSIKGENKHLLFIIQRSVNRMLILVNQLMDFNKLDNDALKLKVKRTDIVSEILRLTEIFRINANNKNILLNICGFEDSFITWVDSDKIDKIMGNLISNAIKFTPVHGNIDVLFDVITHSEASSLFHLTLQDIGSEYVQLSVVNSGENIPEDQLEKIFERYYQLDHQQSGVYNWGTGIGLYYARRLTELHHGYIKASNKKGGGLVFTLIIPVDQQAYSSDKRTSNNDRQDEAFPLLTDAQYRFPDNDIKSSFEKRYTILIVDDDTEVAHYLKVLLSPYYKVVCCFDAVSALQVIENEAPDLILSDVIMPVTNGYELCRAIKNNIHLCHIPVILVTAKATIESQVEGLNTGADAYVTKPFDPAYLLALLKSQLLNRENVRNLLGKTTKIDKIENNILLPQDNVFMTELYQLMEAELSNNELNITRMTEVLKISRTKLYYKIKGLTGMNPNVFFKTYKLNRAMELLAEGKYNISEIADITGFSTLSHFSASFKKQFGVSPSEYALG